VIGLAESGVPYRLPMMKVACKTSMMKEFNIPLEGIYIIYIHIVKYI